LHGPGRRLKRDAVQKASFCEQKEAKKLCESGLCGFHRPRPRSSKSFCAAFFEKRPLSSFFNP
jgi:hypothetical protein